MEKMTVHAGLAELKKLDQRIRRKIMEGRFVGVIKGTKPTAKVYRTTLGKDDFTKSTLAEKDSITDLIDRKNKIKSAIITSNAMTRTQIGKKEMSIAEAIEMKTAIEYKEMLRDALRSQYKSSLALIEQSEENTYESFTAMMAGDPKTNKDLEKMYETYKEDRIFTLVDPIKVETLIAELSEEIEDFKTNVDAALSISNATTYIEIE